MSSAVKNNGWKAWKVGDLCKIKHGFAFKGEFFSDRGELAILTPGNFYEGGGFRDRGDKQKYYIGEVPDGYVLQEKDLVLAMTEQGEGLLGSPALVPCSNRYLHNQRIGLVEDLDSNRIDKSFLYYLFQTKHFIQNVFATSSGAKVRHTSPNRIYEIEVAIPEAGMQKKIASILSCFDDLIENNTKRIKVLEDMVRLVYREWFIQFRFPGHEKVKMVDGGTGLGEVPEGWERKQISDVAAVLRGRAYKGSELADQGGLPFLNLKCFVRDGGFRADGIKRYTGAYKPHQTAVAGDIIMAVTDMTQERRLVARAARVPELEEPLFVFSMDTVKIEPTGNLPKEYLYSMFRFTDFADVIKQFANGANVLHLSPASIEEYTFLSPPEEVMKSFSEIVSPIFALADCLSLANSKLRQSRDLLLPKLISGQIAVI